MTDIKNHIALSTGKDENVDRLAENIAHLVTDARHRAVQTVNTTLVETYWQVGHHIVEFEQQGNAKAKYGDNLLTSLAHLLRAKLCKGFSRPSLYNMRRFYLMYPKIQTVSRKLSWSHICELITIDDDLERSFYEKECIAEHWNMPHTEWTPTCLCRNMNSISPTKRNCADSSTEY